MMQPAHLWNGMGYEMSPITIDLEEEQMWRDFGAHMTEMIVTKPGRKVFPKLNLIVGGLNPQALYGVRIRIERADNFKYRFQGGRWRPCGEEDEAEGKVGKIVKHRGKFAVYLFLTFIINYFDGEIQSGKDWMRRPIDFNHFKMTNNKELDERHMVFAESLHKYIPIVEITDQFGNVLESKRLDVACFITVTAYQNPAIKQLKKSYNPYAAGQLKKSEEQSSSRKRVAGSPLPALQAPPTQATPTQATPTQTTQEARFPSMTPPSMVAPSLAPSFYTTPPSLAQPFGSFPTPPTPTNHQLNHWQTPQRMSNPQFPLTPDTPPSFPGHFQYSNFMPFSNSLLMPGQPPGDPSLMQNQPFQVYDISQMGFDVPDYPLSNMFDHKEDQNQPNTHNNN